VDFDDAAAEHSGSDQNLHVLIESLNVNLILHLVFILAYSRVQNLEITALPRLKLLSEDLIGAKCIIIWEVAQSFRKTNNNPEADMAHVEKCYVGAWKISAA